MRAGEVEVPQELEILEYSAIDNAKERILQSEDVLSVQEQAVSRVEETNRFVELLSAISENVPKSGNAKEISANVESKEARKKGLEGWSREVEISGGRLVISTVRIVANSEKCK